MDMDKQRREHLRWTLLLALNNGRPIGVAEALLLSVTQSLYPDSTPHEVRRELSYLEDRKLVKITKAPSGPWRGDLTHFGVDIAEYTIDCLPGIARPPKYW